MLSAGDLDVGINPLTANDDIADALGRLTANDTNAQIRILADRIGQVASDTAVHRERDAAMADKFDKMESNFEKMETKFDQLDKKIDVIEKQVASIDNKWKGGFATILFLGTVLGGVAAFWDKISNWFALRA